MKLTHWGLSAPGQIGLCGSGGGFRKTIVRDVTCTYCQNIVDQFICTNVSWDLKTLKPELGDPSQGDAMEALEAARRSE
jgi:hypothetical protein